jgi:hypothetical protein
MRTVKTRPIKADDGDAPWPVRVGGLARSAYSYSLGIALALLFVASFILHLRYSAMAENAEAAMHGQPAQSIMEHLASAQFWFESFQNWQSEFFPPQSSWFSRSSYGSKDRRNPSLSLRRIIRQATDTHARRNQTSTR